MLILSEKDIHNCYEGETAKEILFDRIIEKEFILFFGTKGKLQYYPTFAKPFFKVKVDGSYLLKGVEGSQTLRLVFYDDKNKSYSQFLKCLSEYNNRIK